MVTITEVRVAVACERFVEAVDTMVEGYIKNPTYRMMMTNSLLIAMSNLEGPKLNILQAVMQELIKENVITAEEKLREMRESLS